MRKRLAVKSITSPRFHDTGADTVFTVVNWFLLSTVLVIVLLPLMNIVSRHSVIRLPLGEEEYIFSCWFYC